MHTTVIPNRYGEQTLNWSSEEKRTRSLNNLNRRGYIAKPKTHQTKITTCVDCSNAFPYTLDHFSAGLGGHPSKVCLGCNRKREENRPPPMKRYKSRRWFPVNDNAPFETDRYVYAIQGEKGGLIKIGVSCDPYHRLETIQKDVRRRLVLRGAAIGGAWLEVQLHKLFAQYRCYKEWFKPTPEILEWIAEQTFIPSELPLFPARDNKGQSA